MLNNDNINPVLHHIIHRNNNIFKKIINRQIENFFQTLQHQKGKDNF